MKAGYLESAREGKVKDHHHKMAETTPQLDAVEGSEQGAVTGSPKVEGVSGVQAMVPGAVDDAELILQAEDHYANQRHFKAAACLKSVSNESLLEEKHRRMIEMAEKASAVKDELMLPHPETAGWRKQGETHGHRDTMIYYKINPDNTIICRVETPIECSLLVPLLSIFNESELYHTWMPRWKVPRLAMSESNRLKEMGRGHQIVQVCIDMPFPFANRECIQHAFAVDSIEEDGAIVVKVNSMDTGKHFEIEIPEVAKGYRRVDFDGGFLICSCPPDHPALEKSKHKYPAGEKLLLFSLMQQIDAHVAGVPLKLINFFTRTVVSHQWGALLQIAEDVKEGKRPEFQKVIESKQELYEWVEERVEAMIGNME
jgi:hypothetical protein